MSSRDYQTQSEVLREALRLLKEKQAEYHLQSLRDLLAKHLNSAVPEIWNKYEFLS